MGDTMDDFPQVAPLPESSSVPLPLVHEEPPVLDSSPGPPCPNKSESDNVAAESGPQEEAQAPPKAEPDPEEKEDAGQMAAHCANNGVTACDDEEKEKLGDRSVANEKVEKCTKNVAVGHLDNEEAGEEDDDEGEETQSEDNGLPEVPSGVVKAEDDEEEDDDDNGRPLSSLPQGTTHHFNFDPFSDANDSGTEDEQSAFMDELERFHKEHTLEYKPPKFYGKGLNCLKLWRRVTRLGGYDQVTTCKLWRQVGESFNPPKTCTTVSWSFRVFYEKALLEYEKHKVRTGELQIPVSSIPEQSVVERQAGGNQSAGSGRARRDAAARAMQGWHSQRYVNGEVGDPIIKDKSTAALAKNDKNVKSIGLKRKTASSMERAFKAARTKAIKSQSDSMVVDIGEPADWVKINVRQTKDCFEIYALVPGLLREEVHVQSDPAGRLVISGNPEQPDNPWGVTPFKKVITLPSRIDPHQTSAVVTLHGQLFVRAPFEQSDM